MAVVKESTTKGAARFDVRDAARAAAGYFQALYPNVVSFSLEEVELSEKEDYWLIALSFELPPKRTGRGSGTLPILFQPPKTKYKIFKVDVKTGEVVSMRIRNLE